MHILLGNHWIGCVPVDCKVSVIPQEAIFTRFIVKMGAFIAEDGVILQGQESMGKAFGDEEHQLIVFIQLDGKVFSIGG